MRLLIKRLPHPPKQENKGKVTIFAPTASNFYVYLVPVHISTEKEFLLLQVLFEPFMCPAGGATGNEEEAGGGGAAATNRVWRRRDVGATQGQHT